MAPLYTRLIDAFGKGDLPEARRLQSISMRIIRLLAKTGNFFSALKEAMQLLDLNLGGVRAPLHAISSKAAHQLREDLTQLGFLEFCSAKPSGVQ